MVARLLNLETIYRPSWVTRNSNEKRKGRRELKKIEEGLRTREKIFPMKRSLKS